MTPLSVDRAWLNIGDKLGDGGTATVFQASAPEFGEVAFKEYRTGPGVDPDARPDDDSVADLIDVAARMDPVERAVWLERFAWPLSLVTSDDAVIGNLMPEAPDRFYIDYTTGSGARQRTKRRLADMQLLLNSPDFLAHRGIAVSRHQQLALLRSAAEGFAMLHARGIVAGDVSAKNLAFDVGDSESAVYFIDCDAMTDRSAAGDDRCVETADWTVPVAADGSREPLNTVATDSYKFGLLVLRLLTGRQDSRNPAGLPADVSSLGPLLSGSLSGDPAVRPRPVDWVPSLTIAMKRTADPDAARRPRPLVDRGMVVPTSDGVEDVAEVDSAVASTVRRSTAPKLERWQTIVRLDEDQRDAERGAAWIRRMGSVAVLADSGMPVRTPIDFGSDGDTQWVIYRLDEAKNVATVDLTKRERRRLVGRLAHCLDQGVDQGLIHAGLGLDDLGVLRLDNGRAEAVVFGFERTPTPRIGARPPGFDQLVLTVLLAGESAASVVLSQLHAAEFSPDLTCGEYVAEVVWLLDAGAKTSRSAAQQSRSSSADLSPIPSGRPSSSGPSGSEAHERGWARVKSLVAGCGIGTLAALLPAVVVGLVVGIFVGESAAPPTLFAILAVGAGIGALVGFIIGGDDDTSMEHQE